jgi:hypothetical protein
MATSRTSSNDDSGRRVEVDAQLVGMVEVGAPRRPRVEVDHPEVDRPEEVRRVVRAELGGAAAAREADGRRLEPVRGVPGHALLEEELPRGALDEPLHRRRALAQVKARRVGDREVVLGEVELRVPGLGEEDLPRAREAHRAPGGLDVDRFLGHSRRSFQP